jgi:proline racemase
VEILVSGKSGMLTKKVKESFLKNKKVIVAVDSHTMGEPTRIVISGLGAIAGQSMVEKRRYFITHLDHLRTCLMREPRGHRDMFGAVILEPSYLGADLGLLFMDSGGYLTMCGHGTIGAVTVAHQLGLLDRKKAGEEIIVDTPAGVVSARVEISGENLTGVSLRNVPSFVYQKDFVMDVPGIGAISIDIVFGGNFFALVAASQIGLDVLPENIERLIEAGMKILCELRKTVKVRHPNLPELESVELVEIYGPPQAVGAHAKNIVIFGDGQFDRSPCGTGTCAKMAALYAKGHLALQEEFVHESILGTNFHGRLIGEEKVGTISAVIPEITGQAFITGMQEIVIDPDDPLKYGFRLGGDTLANS